MEQEIIKLLDKKKNTSLTSIEINDYLGFNGVNEYSELEKVLNKLCQEGKIYYSEKKKRYTKIENTNFKTGKLLVNPKGYGFVVLDPSFDEDDVYVNGSNLLDGRNNDKVIIEIINKKTREGKVVRILKRDDSSLIGEVYVKNGEYFVHPDKSGYSDIFIPNDKLLGAVEGHKVIVKQINEGHERIGEILKIIGHKNDVGVDILSFVYQYEFEPVHSDEVMEAVANIPNHVLEEEYDGRLDLRDKVIFTIDGDDTKDIDDAVSIEKLSDGYKLGVHIADVSYYVKEGTALNDEAYYRSTSVYLVDRVVPMLPHKLSNGICSLNPNCDRFAMSCIMKINYKGEVVDYEIHPSIIRSRIQMTYNKVNEILENDNIPTGYEEFAEKLKLMNELSDILRKKMVARGYMEFNAPEAKILVDEKCHPYKIELRSQRTGEKLIENFMIVANETVASHIYYQDLPSIYRVHDKPNQEKIQSFLNFLSLRGYVVTGKNKIVSVKDLQNILKQLKDKPDSMVLNDLAIRSQAKAVYS